MDELRCKECGVSLEIPVLDDVPTEIETILSLMDYQTICVKCAFAMAEKEN